MSLQKAQLLEEIRHGLDSKNITIQDIHHIIKTKKTSALPQKTNRLQMLLAYTGALLIFFSIYLFLFMEWSSLPSVARIGLTAGVSLLAFIGSIFAKATRFVHTFLSNVGIFIAALMAPVGYYVFIYTFSSGYAYDYIYYGVLLLLTGFAFICAHLAFRETLYSYFGYLLSMGGVVSIMTYIAYFIPFSSVDDMLQLCGVVLGVSAIAMGRYLQLHDSSLFYNVSLYIVGSFIAFFPLFFLASGSLLWSLLLIIPLILLYIGGYVFSSNALFFSSTIILIVWINYLNFMYFFNELSFTGSLIFTGFSLILVAAFSLRIKFIMNAIGHTLRRNKHS